MSDPPVQKSTEVPTNVHYSHVLIIEKRLNPDHEVLKAKT